MILENLFMDIENNKVNVAKCYKKGDVDKEYMGVVSVVLCNFEIISK